MPATATSASACSVSAKGHCDCQGLRGAQWCCATPQAPCCATPCRATPAAGSARAEGRARLWLTPGGSCVSLLIPFPARLISHDPAQGALSTSGPGPCKQLSRVSCQLFTYNRRTELASSRESPARGQRVAASRWGCTTFTTKQDLFPFFFRIHLKIVFYNLETALISLKHETEEKIVKYETPWGFQGSR